MSKLTLILALLPICFLFGQNDIPTEKIETMMRVTGSSQRFEVVMETLIEQQREDFLFSGSEEFYDLFKSRVMTEGYQEIVKLLIPIYQKHLTENEIDAIIAFYSSEAGKSMIKKFPLISQEAMMVGQEWGEQLAQDITNKITQSKKELFLKEREQCQDYKKGNFYYYLPNGDEVLVERDGELLQKEIFGSNIVVSKIEWVTNCRYRLWELDEDLNIIDDNPVEVNIIQSDTESYQFVSNKQGEEFYSEGSLNLKKDNE